MITAIAAALLFSSQAVAAPTPAPAIEQKDVAFDALSEGRTDQAISKLQEQLVAEPADPATLINLGSAYAQRGDRERAAQAYRAAAASDTRYNVELADGTWVDSRHAARAALLRLDRAQTALLD
jgi:cytochrome c-type biogenesis protein CcmH/NrfG